MLKKVQPGDPLAVPAEAYNAFVETAEAYRQRRFARTTRMTHGAPIAQYGPLDAGTVLIRNDSGEPRDRFDVLGVDGVLIKPVDNEFEFWDRVRLRGGMPSTGHAGRFAILLEPAPQDTIVRACLLGLCQVRVYMADEGHGFAELAVGQAGRLVSGTSGLAQLLWVEPAADRTDPDVAWTVVRLGGGGGGGAGVAYALVTARAGTEPPFLYAGAQAAMDVDGDWSLVSGGREYPTVYNADEQGGAGQWVSPLNVGDLVLMLPRPDGSVDADVCIRCKYRGTY